MAMDYCAWVESQRGKAPPITSWEDMEAEAIADLNVSTHAGTVRKTWTGDHLVLTRVIVRPNSVGKPHRHPAEQIAMILRGGVRVTMGGQQYIARTGSIIHMPRNVIHMFETLDEETEILDVYGLEASAEELRKEYP